MWIIWLIRKQDFFREEGGGRRESLIGWMAPQVLLHCTLKTVICPSRTIYNSYKAKHRYKIYLIPHRSASPTNLSRPIHVTSKICRFIHQATTEVWGPLTSVTWLYGSKAHYLMSYIQRKERKRHILLHAPFCFLRKCRSKRKCRRPH